MNIPTQKQIDAIAADVKRGGVPDSLNRWLDMTPEKLASNQAMLKKMQTMKVDDVKLANPKPAAKTAASDKERVMKTASKKKVETKNVAKAVSKVNGGKPNGSARKAVSGKTTRGSGPSGMVVKILALASRKQGATPEELNKLTEWKGAPWKWLFSNPKKTGYCDRWAYTFFVEKDDKGTHYCVEKK